MYLTFSMFLTSACVTLLSFPACVTSSGQAARENSSIPLDGRCCGGQNVLAFPGRESDGGSLMYLTQSVQLELKKRLSPTAELFIKGDEGFQHMNARYTNYKRPSYIAGVKVAEEKDVIETVRLMPKHPQVRI